MCNWSDFGDRRSARIAYQQIKHIAFRRHKTVNGFQDADKLGHGFWRQIGFYLIKD
jgi:hypothetical protein